MPVMDGEAFGLQNVDFETDAKELLIKSTGIFLIFLIWASL